MKQRGTCRKYMVVNGRHAIVHCPYFLHNKRMFNKPALCLFAEQEVRKLKECPLKEGGADGHRSRADSDAAGA